MHMSVSAGAMRLSVGWPVEKLDGFKPGRRPGIRDDMPGPARHRPTAQEGETSPRGRAGEYQSRGRGIIPHLFYRLSLPAWVVPRPRPSRRV